MTDSPREDGSNVRDTALSGAGLDALVAAVRALPAPVPARPKLRLVLGKGVKHDV